MNYEEEINELKKTIASLTAEIESLKPSMHHAHVMIDAFEQAIKDVALEAADAHEKIDDIIYQNPDLVADLQRVAEILGPYNGPTPNAPPNS